MRRFVPDEVWIEPGELETPIAQTVRSRLPDRPFRLADDLRAAEPADFEAGKRRLVLRRHRSSFLQACPAGTNGLVCCSYLVLNLASNCPLDCSYCFLQEYLANNPALKAFTNVQDALAEVEAVVRAHPQRSFRIGTGELADSLALDPLTALSRHLVPFFAELPNAVLELKTKTDCIEELLDLDPKDRVVVSWSVNAPQVIAADEAGVATLEERIAAARRVQSAGYRLGFHFDPLVEFDGWEKGYAAAVETIFSAVDLERVAWVSLGGLRLTRGLSDVIRRRRRGRYVLGSEMVPSADGKARIWHGMRMRMYRLMVGELQRIGPKMPLYLCMEAPSVWERVMNDTPTDRLLGMRLAAGATW